jgi:periplasmic copper chaperone A
MRGFVGMIAAALLLAGCQAKPAETTVDKAWVRLPSAKGNPGAAYFTVHGGSKPAALLAVRARFALRTELHETVTGPGGMMKMAPIKDVAVPANGTLAFAPGGRHVMLFDVSPDVKPGGKAPLTLSFADGRNIEVQAQLLSAGDPAPK